MSASSRSSRRSCRAVPRPDGNIRYGTLLQAQMPPMGITHLGVSGEMGGAGRGADLPESDRRLYAGRLLMQKSNPSGPDLPRRRPGHRRTRPPRAHPRPHRLLTLHPYTSGREHVGAPVQMMTAVHNGHVIELPLVARGEPPVPVLVECEPPELVEACAKVVGVAVTEVRGRSRRRRASQARALALYVWCGVLQRRAVVMATYVGRSESAASRLWSNGSPALRSALPKLDAVLAELGIGQGS